MFTKTFAIPRSSVRQMISDDVANDNENDGNAFNNRDWPVR